MADQIAAPGSIEEFLVAKGYVTKEVLQKATLLREHGGKGDTPADLQTVLINEKLIDEETLAEARALFFNLPYIDLRKKQASPEIINLIPKESTNFYNLAAFERVGDTLRVAVTDPNNLAALGALEFLGQKQNVQIQLYLASMDSIDTFLGRKKNLSSVVGEALKNIEQKETEEKKTVNIRPAQLEKLNIEDAPIIKIVDVILSNAIESGASDIHIEPSENEVRVRYRIDGILHTSLMLPKNVHAAIISRVKILTNLKIDESRLPQDGRFHFETGNKSVDLRVSILPLIYGEKIVMRILDKTTSVPTLEQLGVRGRNLKWIEENIKKTHGIFLITGPTGSGKSTTLYSILHLLNTPNVNISTLEDPVEYFMEGVNQTQINQDIGLTFASGLRSLLRQDPNIMMVGEIRDKETAELAVHAALTGHLVFSTLHTNNAIGAMPRMIDMGMEPFLLTASVNLVMAQRLVRKVCQDCKVEDKMVPGALEEIKRLLGNVPDDYLEGIDKNVIKGYKGQGCEKCGNTGYRGRFGIFEVLPISIEIQQMILEKQTPSKMFDSAAKLGMISMKQDGAIKILRGETTLDEVIRVTTE